MIKTKSILAKQHKTDGTRICIMRFVKPSYDYDEWLRDLAPSMDLLYAYRHDPFVGWKVFEARYIEEMKKAKDLIKLLKSRSNGGETITLLCWEYTGKFCHRRLLKELIEQS